VDLVLGSLSLPGGRERVARLARHLQLELAPGLTRAQIARAVSCAANLESAVGRIERRERAA
jgi:hypothetical protein